MLGGGFFCGLYSRLIFRSLSLFLQFFTVCFFSYFPAFAYFHHCPHISIPYKYIKNQMILSYFSLILFTKYVLSLWHNKDKPENPCGARSWLVCPYPCSNQSPDKIGVTREARSEMKHKGQRPCIASSRGPDCWHHIRTCPGNSHSRPAQDGICQG